jgi:hypothetical protein
MDGQTPPHLDPRQALIRRATRAEHVGDRQPGSYSQIELLRLVHLRPRGATAETKRADTIAGDSATT